MLTEIRYLAKDSAIKVDWAKFKERKEDETPCRIDVTITINGKHAFDIESCALIKSAEGKSCVNYKVFKHIALRAIDRAVERDPELFSSDKTIDGAIVNGLTNEFWQQTHAEHLKIDLPKLPPEVKHAYDFDVSVTVNGYMLYHGWMVVGCNREMACNEVPGIVSGIISDMSERTDHPSEEDLKIILAQ